MSIFCLTIMGCEQKSISKESIKGNAQFAVKEDPIALYSYYDSIAQSKEPFSSKSMLTAAMSGIDQMISKTPNNPSLYRLKASLLFQNFESEKAISLLEMAEKKFASEHSISLQKTQYLYYLKRYDQAFLGLNAILREHPSEAEAYFQLGLIFREQGDFEKAMNSLTRATELDADLTDGWLILGDLYSLEGDPVIAQRFYENAVLSDPKNSHAQHALAHWKQQHGSLEDALEIYHAILNHDSLYQDAYLNSAIIYLEMDSITQAQQLLERLTSINPNREKAYYYLAYIELQKNEYANALVAIDRALALNPNSTNGLLLKDEIISRIKQKSQ